MGFNEDINDESVYNDFTNLNKFFPSQYMMRAFPMLEMYMEFSNDKPFYSIKQVWMNAIKNINNFCGLIPEFFSFPEIFINSNEIRFGILNNNAIMLG